MRPDRCVRLLLLVLGCLASLPAAARWYQVEVVVFRHGGALTTGGEIFSEPEALPDFGGTVSLISEDDEAVDGADATLLPFRALARAERRLAGVERRLRNSADYEPLMAAAWRQPSYGVSRARRVYLSDVPPPTPDESAMPRPQPRIEGVLAIKVSRLLHVELDFLYDADGVPVRLTETRKLKLREIHYFDHPLFGAIVQVSPWVPPAPETPDAATEPATAEEAAAAPAS